MLDEMPSKSQDSLEKLSAKKSWPELRQAVRDVRKQLSNVTTKVPSCFNFWTVHNSLGTKTRLYFLSASANGRETTLLFSDVPDCSSEVVPTMVWQPLLEASFQLLSNVGRISKEEQLQWERKRLVTWGITSYEFHSRTGRFVFPVCGSLFSFVDNPLLWSAPYFPTELNTSCSGALLNPQLCPTDANLVAYIFNSDIWVQNLTSGSERRLTFAHKGLKSLAEDYISAGIPSYVMQEEFNRYIGFWWQPETTTSGHYRILYEEIDESDVEIVFFSSPCNEDRGIEEYRFPRAGTCNAKSTLKLVEFELDEKGEVHQIRYRHMMEHLSELFPWLEYLVRVGWTPNGERIWAQLLNRRQQHLELILIPLQLFVLIEQSYEMPINETDVIPAVQILLTENSDVWINIHDVLHFSSQIDDNSVSFVWASEKAGFRHLFFITCDISSKSYHDDDDNVTDLVPNCVKSNAVYEVQLTSGDWEVLDKQIWIDEHRQLVYFMGFKDTPLEKHLYVVSISTPGVITRLTEIGFSHSVSMNSDRTMFVTVYSNIETTPASQVFRITHSNSVCNVDGIHVMSCGYLLKSSPDLANNCPVPELFSYQIKSGDVLYGLIFKPVNLIPGEKYPAVLSVYGGPEVQLVTNTFKGLRQLRLHMLADQGYVVLVIDSRGSRHRGLKFESHLKDRMGTVEIQDQVEVLEWLSQTVDYIDFSRLAIHGWSYGGYLSLMGLAQRPEIFKIAIAGAPVTSWSLYDTGYTERYMGLPSANTQGYKDGSVLSYVSLFPNEENRLLIIHGLIDENVHFFHTNQLINSLIRAGKPYQLQVYPNERHSLRHLEASEHYETTLLSFLQTWL